MKKITVEHDDNAIDVIDKVNKALKEHRLVFEDDGEEHDGFVVLKLKERE